MLSPPIPAENWEKKPGRPKKIKLSTSDDIVFDEEHCFLLSILPTMRELPHALKLQMRLEILEVVSKFYNLQQMLYVFDTDTSNPLSNCPPSPQSWGVVILCILCKKNIVLHYSFLYYINMNYNFVCNKLM